MTPISSHRCALVGVEHGELKFQVGSGKVKFNVCKLMKRLDEHRVVSVIDVEDESGEGHCDGSLLLDVDLSLSLLCHYVKSSSSWKATQVSLNSLDFAFWFFRFVLRMHENAE